MVKIKREGKWLFLTAETSKELKVLQEFYEKRAVLTAEGIRENRQGELEFGYWVYER